jgi:hypothetical protein
MRDTLLTFHILATGLWIGANVVGLLVNRQLNPKASAIASDPWYFALVGVKRYLYPPTYLTILITGVLLITTNEDSTFAFSDTFNVIGIAAVLIGAWLGMIYFERQGGKIGAAFAAGDMGAAASIKTKMTIGQLVDMGVVVLATVAMIGTWGV